MKKFQWLFCVCLMIGFSNPGWADSVGYDPPGTQYEVCSANNQVCAKVTKPQTLMKRQRRQRFIGKTIKKLFYIIWIHSHPLYQTMVVMPSVAVAFGIGGLKGVKQQ